MASTPLSTPTAGSAAKTTAVSGGKVPSPVGAAPPAAETARPPAAAAAPAQQPHPAARSMRALAIRSRDWRTAWLLALCKPSVATFEGLAAHPAAGFERALVWCLTAAAVGTLLPAGLSLLRGTPLLTLLPAYVVLAAMSAGAVVAGTAVACGLALHLEADGLGRPEHSSRHALPGSAAPVGVGQRSAYTRLVFACAAFAAPMLVVLGLMVVTLSWVGGPLTFGMGLYALMLAVLAVRAACKVAWAWAVAAGVAGSLVALLLLAAVAGAWAGLTS